jgi:hypothetical protein
VNRPTPRQLTRERKRARASTALNVVVVTAFGNDRESGNGLSLRRDIELVRACILYADEVELVSLTATALESLMRLGSSDSRNIIKFLSSLDEETFQALGGSTFPEGWREKLPLAMASARGRRTLDTITAPMIDGVRREGLQIYTESGASELAPALNSGVVKLTPAADHRAMANALASYHTDSSRRFTDPTNLLQDWLGLLGKLLDDPRKRLLFVPRPEA